MPTVSVWDNITPITFSGINKHVTTASKPPCKGVYAITDERLLPENLFPQKIRQALEGGVRIIQYRDKSADATKRLEQATLLRHLCQQYQALLIINDDIELCRAVQADGVHLGEEDNAISYARTRLGHHAIIGASCYNQFSLAKQAKQSGADYVAFGTLFPSPTKPDAVTAELGLIEKASKHLNIPVCAIGGITADNASKPISAGADMIAVISSLFAQTDIQKTADKMARLFHAD